MEDRATSASWLVSDERAAQALRIHATSLVEQAERLERGHGLPPANPDK